MKSDNILKKSSKEYFHKICVVGGGLTGAIMTLLLKKSNLFNLVLRLADDGAAA